MQYLYRWKLLRKYYTICFELILISCSHLWCVQKIIPWTYRGGVELAQIEFTEIDFAKTELAAQTRYRRIWTRRGILDLFMQDYVSWIALVYFLFKILLLFVLHNWFYIVQHRQDQFRWTRIIARKVSHKTASAHEFRFIYKYITNSQEHSPQSVWYDLHLHSRVDYKVALK